MKHFTHYTLFTMMFVLILQFWLQMGAHTNAQANVQSVTPTKEAEATQESDLKELKERLASVVARLKDNDQLRAGRLVEIGEGSLVIEISETQKETVALDDVITQYFRIAGSAKEDITKTEVKVGEYLIVVGYIGDSGMTANEIYLDTPFESEAGRVVEIDAGKSTLKLDTFDKDSISVNILRSTVVEMVSTSTGVVVQSGFSSIKEGDVVHAIYEKPLANGTTISPVRVLVVPAQYFAGP